MKKLLSLILILALVPVIALADVDVKSMTDQELKDMIAACSAELMSRNTVEAEGILLFDDGGIRIYQTGDAYIERGRIRVPCVFYNDLDIGASISPVFVSCNGITVHGYGSEQIPAKSKSKGELDFSTEGFELNSLDDINSFIFCWQIYSYDKPGVVYGPSDPEEHRFW